tara:strand:- start:152 stop:322 length:171 start_codon:yes stop_codon:yes gene_type:complete
LHWDQPCLLQEQWSLSSLVQPQKFSSWSISYRRSLLSPLLPLPESQLAAGLSPEHL